MFPSMHDRHASRCKNTDNFLIDVFFCEKIETGKADTSLRGTKQSPEQQNASTCY